MNIEETSRLLAIAQMYDFRDVDEGVIIAWHEILGDLPFGDARDAVLGHYRDETIRLMPAHVRARVKDIRAERLQKAGTLRYPPQLADFPIPASRWAKAATAAIAGGLPVPDAPSLEELQVMRAEAIARGER